MNGGREQAGPEHGRASRPPPEPAAAEEARRALPPPGAALTPAQVLRLQRAIGNRAVGRLLQAGAPAAPPRAVQRAPAATAKDQEEWETERAEQLKTHRKNQKKVYDLVDSNAVPLVKPARLPGVPADREEVFRNTAEFIKRRLILVALTPTLSTRLYPPGKPKLPAPALSGNLFFDENTVYPEDGAKAVGAIEGVDAAQAGVYTRTTGETAHADPSGKPVTMRLFLDREFPEETLKTVLIHETQHLADRHGASSVEEGRGSFEEAGIEDVNKADGDVATTYRTEFRAYWLGDKGGGKSFGDASKPAKNTRKLQWGTVLFWRYLNTAFKNERQENIFWYMVDASIYPWVKVNYYFTPAFKTLVDGLDMPTGGNLLNSLRIDNLRFGLRDMAEVVSKLAVELKDQQEGDEGDLGWSREEGRIVQQHRDVADAAKALNEADREFLTSGASKPFWDFFDRCYAPAIRVARVEYVKQHVKAVEKSQIEGR